MRARIVALAPLLTLLLFGLSMTNLAWFVVGGRPLALRYGQDVDLISVLLWALLTVATRLPVSDALLAGLAKAAYVASSGTLAGFAALTAYETGQAVPVLTWSVVMVAIYPLVAPGPAGRTAPVVGLAVAGAYAGLGLAAMSQGLSPQLDLLAALPTFVAAGSVAVIGALAVHRTQVDVALLTEQEAMLGAVLAATDDGMVLQTRDGSPRFANAAAAELPDPRGLGSDELVQVGARSYQVQQRELSLRGRDHVLSTVREVTRTVDRATLEAWRELLRALTHELNNSLAPMSSMVHSLGRIVAGSAEGDRAKTVLQALQARVDHLSRFLREHARLARLPVPRPAPVAWRPWLDRQAAGLGFSIEACEIDEGWFDDGQLEQVLINLVQNSWDAGATRVGVSVLEGPTLVVQDDGEGLSEEARASAGVPGFTTRPEGSGVGLALCREIIVAHQGSLRLLSPASGGVRVEVRLPPYSPNPVRK